MGGGSFGGRARRVHSGWRLGAVARVQRLIVGEVSRHPRSDTLWLCRGGVCLPVGYAPPAAHARPLHACESLLLWEASVRSAGRRRAGGAWSIPVRAGRPRVVDGGARGVQAFRLVGGALQRPVCRGHPRCLARARAWRSLGDQPFHPASASPSTGRILRLLLRRRPRLAAGPEPGAVAADGPALRRARPALRRRAHARRQGAGPAPAVRRRRRAMAADW
mmetsp:Transcript_33740/g.107647  ORF Transcript_33740/g.107647 Transcript_33740/m.107647 type:complete len:220 (+) Transcript_33740:1252-1911(+)